MIFFRVFRDFPTNAPAFSPAVRSGFAECPMVEWEFGRKLENRRRWETSVSNGGVGENFGRL
jgi:hypothetical protein